MMLSREQGKDREQKSEGNVLSSIEQAHALLIESSHRIFIALAVQLSVLGGITLYPVLATTAA
jgi:hypothetical protein